ncbi:MAG: hypothetical protein QS721_13045 [Candidatus Endonucleobacter sp. (ex Gigantidas childressi)]|nr:hypothetical protein [Candidatus Endonucleobacter sp. (ex Gigantidas childressi)]
MKRALMRLNSRPRKDFNFKTPALIIGEHIRLMTNISYINYCSNSQIVDSTPTHSITYHS